MSLQTDSVFIKALSWAPAGRVSVLDTFKGRVYGTAIPLPDEDLDNEPLPYCIVAFQGLTNIGQTKDDVFEGDGDSVQIAVTIAASTLDSLHELTVLVRERIRSYFVANYDEDEIPTGYQFSAGPINYDSMKPCYWQTLNYDCDTLNDNELWQQ